MILELVVPCDVFLQDEMHFIYNVERGKVEDNVTFGNASETKPSRTSIVLAEARETHFRKIHYEWDARRGKILSSSSSTFEFFAFLFRSSNSSLIGCREKRVY